jgi:hypothetical protein
MYVNDTMRLVDIITGIGRGEKQKKSTKPQNK